MIKRITLTLVAMLITLFAYCQNTYTNFASVKSIQDDAVIGEKTMLVSVSVNESMDTLYWSANQSYKGKFPITKVEVKGNTTTYRCNPKGNREAALFTIYNEEPDTYCKLLIRNGDGYIKFVFIG